MERSCRKIFRLVWLGSELSFAFIRYFFRVAFVSADQIERARLNWLQRSAIRFMRVLHVELETFGVQPKEGLLVCNHLSYLDIIIIAAVAPGRFVAKREVRSWPVFGPLARLAGTIFVDRERRSKATHSNSELKKALEQGELITLFPEGTSSDGETVLPFKSALLEPVADSDHPVSVGHIQYFLRDGNVADEVCYWRDMTLAPHLFNLLGKREIHARIAFAPFQESRLDRKQLARRLHAEVTRLKSDGPACDLVAA